MASPRRQGNVYMVVGSLEARGSFPLPAPYKFRTYRKGDERTWYGVWDDADSEHHGATPETFGRDFGSDEGALPKRMFFIDDASGKAVATATAWYPEDRAEGVGLVHWVAVVKAAQGKGLSKPLVAKVLERLSELGYRSARLATQPYRLRAIKVYLDFGFLPEIKSEDDRALWREVRDNMPGTVLDGMELGA